jgi:hypothetical protein
MAGWKRFALMFLMVAVPVPVFAASGLAVPLPAVVYRAAVGLAQQTQAVAVRVPVVGSVVAETTRVARKGTIRFSAAELASGGGEAARSDFRLEPGGPASQSARRTRLGRGVKNADTHPASASPAPARRAKRVRDMGNAPAASGERGSRGGAKEETPQAATAPPGQSETAREQKPAPANREEPAGGLTPAPAHPAETKNPPKEDSRTPTPAPPTSPPPAPPPPSPSPLPISPPVDSVSDPLPLTPEAQLDAIADDLRKLVEAKPGTRRADRLQQVLDKVESASARLAKKPPDNEGAIGDIRNAVQKLDAALLEGVISPLERTEFATRLEAVSTLLKARL